MEDNKVLEKVEQIKKDLQETQEIDLLSNIIKNNQIEFEHAGIKYRVRKPTFQQKLKTNEEKTKKYIYLLKQKNSDGSPMNLLEKDLIKIYKERGEDIDEMDQKYQSLEHQKKDLSMKLGKALTEDKSQEELDIFRNEIEKLILQQQDIMIKKSILLDSAIESQINLFSYSYLSFLLAEKEITLIEGQISWEKAWISYESFLQEADALVNLVVWYTTLIARNEIPLS